MGADIDLRDLQVRLVNIPRNERTVFGNDIILYFPQQEPGPDWLWSRQTLSVSTTEKETVKV